MNTVCAIDKCVGCMACVSSCPNNAIKIEETFFSCNAFLTDKCINCKRCQAVCQQINQPQLSAPILFYQGWNREDVSRKLATSGGVATGIAKSFIQNGGKAVMCCFVDGDLRYQMIDNIECVDQYRGSKYTKSSMTNIHKVIIHELRAGNKVLFIGLPCHVASLIKVTSIEEQNNLYLIDLICHGAPSQKLLKLFLKDYPEFLEKLISTGQIRFRDKYGYHISVGDEAIVDGRILDDYSMAFVSGLSFTENCYDCQFARLDRVSDLTLGDSWGSELPEEEKRKGVSLILCQSDKGKELLGNADIVLNSVDMNKAISYNNQLNHPVLRTKRRRKFVAEINRHQSFSKAVHSSLFFLSLKQDIKKILLSQRKS